MKTNNKESSQNQPATAGQNAPSAPARHENPEQTDQHAPAGGGSGAAPCSTDLVLDQIGRWLQGGATIKATDIKKPILKILKDGSCVSNLTIEYPYKNFDNSLAFPNARIVGH